MKNLEYILALGLITVACSEKKEAPSAPKAPPMPSLTAPTKATVTTPGATAVAQPADAKVQVADIPVDLEALSKAVYDYCQKTHNNPGSLEEVARSGFIKTLPKLPAGKRLAIDGLTYKVIIEDIPQ